MHCSWDEGKNLINARKHGISLEEVSQIFENAATLYEPSWCEADEERAVAVGFVGLKLVKVVFVERGEYIRIISARKCTRWEERYYAERT